jgi:ribosome maturation factor RimP
MGSILDETPSQGRLGMTRDRQQHQPKPTARKRGDAELGSGSESGSESDVEDSGLGGRHAQAVVLLESAVEPLVEDLGYELLLLEWLGAGKRRLMRLYIDSPAGVTIEDCTRLGRVLSNALDARETAAATEDSEVRDPVLAALLGKPYTLEVSSPGVDRPLTRRRHFADHVGGRTKIETWAPLDPEGREKKFYGRIVAVEEDPAAPDDQRRGVVVVHDADGDRTLRIPLPRIRRANLVWEG